MRLEGRISVPNVDDKLFMLHTQIGAVTCGIADGGAPTVVGTHIMEHESHPTHKYACELAC